MFKVNDARSRGDGCDICIDGRVQVDGGNILCDCKLEKEPQQDEKKK